MNTTEQIAHHLESADYDSFDETELRRARTRLLDAIGNIAAGRDAGGNDKFVRVVRSWGGAEQSSVFFRDLRLPSHAAAMLNALAMRSYDFESVGAEAPDASMGAAHIAGTTVPVALAMAERTGATGRDTLTALLLGDDLASRLGIASGFHTASGGDNTGTVNGLGAVAIAGRLLGLSAQQYVDGLGIALNQLSGTVDNLFDAAEAFKLPQANSARNGVFSAELAAEGFTGPRDAIAGRFGFFTMFSPGPKPEQLTVELGERYFADMIIKPWSSCRAAHPSLDAAIRLSEEHGLDAADIAAVRVHVTPTTKTGFTGGEFAPTRNREIAAMFNIRYNVAVGLLYREFRPEHLAPEVMDRDDVRDLLARIELVDSLPPTEYQTAEVEIALRDGRTVRTRTDAVLGDIYRRPLDDAAIREKFERNMAFGVGADAARIAEIAEVVERVDELDDIRDLTALLR